MRGLSLFSGIGGLDMAAEAAGIEIAAMCEINPFCVRILGKRWPGMTVLDDVRKIEGDTIGGDIDIVFGGFPCQDLSTARAGGQKGLGGKRSGLWFEMLRIVRELGPVWVLAENVRGAVHLALDVVREGLEDAGYKVRSFIIPGSAYGAPHRRERLFICAARRDAIEGLAVPPPSPSVGNPLERWRELYGIAPPAGARRHVDKYGEDDFLNPDWTEQMMCFPEGWTDPDRDELRAWQGFPAPMRGIEGRIWPTPLASDCRGGRSTLNCFRNYVYFLREGKLWSEQRDYEFPVLAPKGAYWEERLTCIGNAVMPLQPYPLFKAMHDMHCAICGRKE